MLRQRASQLHSITNTMNPSLGGDEFTTSRHPGGHLPFQSEESRAALCASNDPAHPAQLLATSNLATTCVLLHRKRASRRADPNTGNTQKRWGKNMAFVQIWLVFCLPLPLSSHRLQRKGMGRDFFANHGTGSVGLTAALGTRCGDLHGSAMETVAVQLLALLSPWPLCLLQLRLPGNEDCRGVLD